MAVLSKNLAYRCSRPNMTGPSIKRLQLLELTKKVAIVRAEVKLFGKVMSLDYVFPAKRITQEWVRGKSEYILQ